MYMCGISIIFIRSQNKNIFHKIVDSLFHIIIYVCAYNKTFIFLLYSKEDAHVIFRDAAALNMTETGHVWIVTEQALNANNTPDGILGLELKHANSENKHIKVSWILYIYIIPLYLYTIVCT